MNSSERKISSHVLTVLTFIYPSMRIDISLQLSSSIVWLQKYCEFVIWSIDFCLTFVVSEIFEGNRWFIHSDASKLFRYTNLIIKKYEFIHTYSTITTYPYIPTFDQFHDLQSIVPVMINYFVQFLPICLKMNTLFSFRFVETQRRTRNFYHLKKGW